MTAYTNKTLLLMGGSIIINLEVLRHFLDRGVQQLRLFSGDEEGMTLLRDTLAKESSADATRVKFFVGDIDDPAYLEETMHGVDYVLYAPAMKSSVECEDQPAEACDSIFNPVNNVICTALSQNVSKIVVINTAYQEPLTNVKSLIAALLEKVVVAQGRYLGEDSKSAVLCVRAKQGECIELADYAFSSAVNGELLFKTEDGNRHIPCEHFDLSREE